MHWRREKSSLSTSTGLDSKPLPYKKNVGAFDVENKYLFLSAHPRHAFLVSSRPLSSSPPACGPLFSVGCRPAGWKGQPLWWAAGCNLSPVCGHFLPFNWKHVSTSRQSSPPTFFSLLLYLIRMVVHKRFQQKWMRDEWIMFGSLSVASRGDG